MNSDNNQEMFPLVDEQGNITGAATRGECHNGSKLLHPVIHIRRRTCGFGRKRRNGSEARSARRTGYHGLYA